MRLIIPSSTQMNSIIEYVPHEIIGSIYLFINSIGRIMLSRSSKFLNNLLPKIKFDKDTYYYLIIAENNFNFFKQIIEEDMSVSNFRFNFRNATLMHKIIDIENIKIFNYVINLDIKHDLRHVLYDTAERNKIEMFTLAVEKGYSDSLMVWYLVSRERYDLLHILCPNEAKRFIEQEHKNHHLRPTPRPFCMLCQDEKNFNENFDTIISQYSSENPKNFTKTKKYSILSKFQKDLSEQKSKQNKVKTIKTNKLFKCHKNIKAVKYHKTH
jgi:hypothetical protein